MGPSVRFHSAAQGKSVKKLPAAHVPISHDEYNITQDKHIIDFKNGARNVLSTYKQTGKRECIKYSPTGQVTSRALFVAPDVLKTPPKVKTKSRNKRITTDKMGSC